MAEALTHAKENQVFNLYLDKTGNVATFFTYQAVNVHEFAKDKLGATMGQKNWDDIYEGYRKSVVRCMKHGGTVCWNIGKMTPNFKTEVRSDNFPSELVFDPVAIRNKEIYWKALIHEGTEDREEYLPPLEVPGWDQKPDFSVAFIADYQEGTTDIEAIKAGIPCADKLHVYIVS